MTHIIVDIETLPLPVPPDAIAEKRLELMEQYKKDETIESHLQAWIQKFRFKPEGAQPVAIALSSVVRGKATEPEGIQTDNENEIAKFFVDYLNEEPQPKLVGYNILGFDLPVLCRVLFNSGLELNQKVTKWGRIDLMREPFGYGFDNSGGFKRMCKMYGVELCGVTGDEVENLWAKDQAEGTQRVLEYCKDDVRGCAELFIKFSRFFDFG